jgi:hypothetical protein
LIGNFNCTAIEVFKMFKQNCVVGRLQYTFLPLGRGLALQSIFCPCAQDTKPGPQHHSDKGKLVGVSRIALCVCGVIYGLRVGLVKGQLSTFAASTLDALLLCTKKKSPLGTQRFYFMDHAGFHFCKYPCLSLCNSTYATAMVSPNIFYSRGNRV